MTFYETWEYMRNQVQTAGNQVPTLYMTELQIREFCERTGAEYCIEHSFDTPSTFTLRYRNVAYRGILLSEFAGMNGDSIYMIQPDGYRPPRVMYEGVWPQERISDLFVQFIDQPIEDDIGNMDSIL